MDAALLDNPFWSSLRTRHRGIACVAGEVARYPADHAPFLGIADAGVDATDALEALVEPGEDVLLLGVAPERVPRGWRLEAFRPLAQMVREAPVAVVDGPRAIPLADAHRDDVLALTALVYPHYFRARTMELGRYHGNGRLAAIIGERMGMDEWQEISAVCTHPEFIGRGYAQRLVALLVNAVLERGDTPFLHTHRDNTRALALYDHLGFKIRTEVMLWHVTRDRAAR